MSSVKSGSEWVNLQGDNPCALPSAFGYRFRSDVEKCFYSWWRYLHVLERYAILQCPFRAYSTWRDAALDELTTGFVTDWLLSGVMVPEVLKDVVVFRVFAIAKGLNPFKLGFSPAKYDINDFVQMKNDFLEVK